MKQNLLHDQCIWSTVPRAGYTSVSRKTLVVRGISSLISGVALVMELLLQNRFGKGRKHCYNGFLVDSAV